MIWKTEFLSWLHLMFFIQDRFYVCSKFDSIFAHTIRKPLFFFFKLKIDSSYEVKGKIPSILHYFEDDHTLVYRNFTSIPCWKSTCRSPQNLLLLLFIQVLFCFVVVVVTFFAFLLLRPSGTSALHRFHSIKCRIL